MRLLVIALLAGLALTASPEAARSAPAGGCEAGPFLSIVPKCIPMSPDGGLAYSVTIICANGPLYNSSIEVRFTPVGDTLVCWCNTVPGPRPRSFFATTNFSGVATFYLAGGGCVQYGLSAIPGPQKFAAEVFADGVKMQECGIVSPDAVDASGRLATSSPAWDPAGVCATGLSDGVRHTTPLSTSVYQWCTDMNCDNAVTLADGVILTPFVAGAASCPGNAGP